MTSRNTIIAGIVFTLSAPALTATAVEQDWVDRYSGPGGYSDRGYDIVTDSQGATIVGGYTQISAGQTIRAHMLAIKYAPDGTRQWVSTWDAGSAGANEMAIDHLDNIILVGSANAGDDFAIRKLDTDGNEMWSDIYPVPPAFLTKFEDVAIDPTGAIYVTGSYWTNANDPWTLVVVKYDPDGTIAWDIHYTAASAFGYGIAVSDQGEAYVGGWLESEPDDRDMMILKVDTLGAVDWVQTFGRTRRYANDSAYDIAMDSNGNVVATGGYSGVPGLSGDLAVVRLAPDGTLVSEGLYDGPDMKNDNGWSLALDANDNALVAGRSGNLDSNDDAVVVKFAPDGTVMWAGRYATIGRDWPFRIVVDDLGWSYAVGEADPNFTGVSQYFTIAFDADGTQQWLMNYEGPAQGTSYALGVTIGTERSVVITGFSASAVGADDAATIRYTQPPVITPGDTNGDGVVDFQDLLAVLGAWGPCGECPEDLDGDGFVTFSDILIILANWS